MPKLSIIIPVYKVEKYIRECLDSIKNQTFTDFEVLLIDDGSPDNSGQICDEYASEDLRFKVIHKKNEGVSAARNLGLDIAEGEWIHFVDSDDYLLSDDVYREIFDLDIDDFDAVNVGVKGQWETVFKWTGDPKDWKEAKKAYLNTLTGFVCCNIYKKRVIGDTRFKKMAFAEDLLFLNEIAFKDSKFLFTGKKIYYYRKHDESLIQGKYIPTYLEDIYTLMNKLNELDEKNLIYTRWFLDDNLLSFYLFGIMVELRRNDKKASAKKLKEYADKFQMNKLIDERGIKNMAKWNYSWIFVRLGMFKTLLTLHPIFEKLKNK